MFLGPDHDIQMNRNAIIYFFFQSAEHIAYGTMAAARKPSLSSNSSDESFSQNTELQHAIDDFVITKVNEILQAREAETNVHIEEEIERRVAIAVANSDNSTTDQQLLGAIFKQTHTINKLLEQQTIFAADLGRLLSKIGKFSDEIGEINLSLKEMHRQFEQLDIAASMQPKSESPMSASPVDIKLDHEISAFFATRVPLGLNYPPPKITLPELNDQDLFPLYGAPPEQVPSLPHLVQQLFTQQAYYEQNSVKTKQTKHAE